MNEKNNITLTDLALTLKERCFVTEMQDIVRTNLKQAYSAINFSQVATNWNLGRRIVEEEQNGQNRAEYGKRVIVIASKALTEEFGKRYSETNCKNFRRFCLMFKEYAISHTASDQSVKLIRPKIAIKTETQNEGVSKF